MIDNESMTEEELQNRANMISEKFATARASTIKKQHKRATRIFDDMLGKQYQQEAAEREYDERLKRMARQQIIPAEAWS